MKITKFPPNEDDNLHCLQSSVRMVFETMMGASLSLEESESFTGFVEGLQTWPFTTMLSFAQRGFEVVNIEKMDNELFAQSPKEACIKEYGENMWEHFIKISDVKKAQQDALACIKNDNINMIKPIPLLPDISDLIRDGFLLICNVNTKALNEKNGYNGHFIVVESVNSDNREIHIQNPGLPAMQDQIVSTDLFEDAWYSPNKNAGNILAIRQAT